jgi:hypothetical protein
MLPLIAYADSVDTFLGKLNAKIINPLIEFAFIIALVIFLFGVMEFIRGSGNEEKRTLGKQHMIWGVVGFLIMFGVFGIMELIVNTFGLGTASFNQEEQVFKPKCIQELKFDGQSEGSIVPCE